ncbi:unnamed protein product [Ixodes pacificus]
MQQAGVEEARRAKEFGEIDAEGYPLGTVVADCAWSNRSYKNYAPSGMIERFCCSVERTTRKCLNLLRSLPRSRTCGDQDFWKIGSQVMKNCLVTNHYKLAMKSIRNNQCREKLYKNTLSCRGCNQL